MFIASAIFLRLIRQSYRTTYQSDSSLLQLYVLALVLALTQRVGCFSFQVDSPMFLPFSQQGIVCSFPLSYIKCASRSARPLVDRRRNLLKIEENLYISSNYNAVELSISKRGIEFLHKRHKANVPAPVALSLHLPLTVSLVDFPSFLSFNGIFRLNFKSCQRFQNIYISTKARSSEYH